MNHELELKKQARRLLKHLDAQGIQMPYNQGLEALAAVHGAANWNTLRASAGKARADGAKGDALQALIDAQGGYWAEHPEYPTSDWQYLVANGDTRQGYWEWVQGELEANSHVPAPPTPTEPYVVELADIGEDDEYLWANLTVRARPGEEPDTYTCMSIVRKDMPAEKKEKFIREVTSRLVAHWPDPDGVDARVMESAFIWLCQGPLIEL